ncbi:MAG: DUF262 domain-containing protein [Myxococcales bacterium]|nr:DUF262 domain-containing protein [Myxococcales bacterium]
MSEVDRIRAKIERVVPDEDERVAALRVLAFAVENADDERPNGWYLRETSRGLSLFAGRLFACGIQRGRLGLSVLGPVDDETRAHLGADAEDDEQFSAVPGGLLVWIHIEKAAQALGLLGAQFEKFVDEAMARVRRKVSTDSHSPDALAYLSSVVGRELPQPSTADEDLAPDESAEAGEDDLQARDPKVRGRAPLFSHSQVPIGALLSEIQGKTLALPDLQRPFVWEDTKVRDLLDSIFVGFPVGTLVLWHTADGKDAKLVGGAPDSLRANTLIIDGQQRLTSLFAVMRGAEVTERDGSKRTITIAFRPRDGRFEVASAVTAKDPEFLPNITELWSSTRMKGQIRRELLAALRAQGRQVDDAYEAAVEENLDRAQAITEYQFPVVRIQQSSNTAEANDEDVAEIFVRINNQGKRLGQADFVLTLLSVFQGDLRDRIERRAVEMSQDAVIELDTQQLLRATCAVGFSRAKMSSIYRFLRGIDPATGDTNVENRQKRIATLRAASEECLDATRWRDFMLRVVRAGLVNQALVASNNAIVNGYAFYVLGQRLAVSKPQLEEVISRWLFGTLLSARYSGSSETVFEKDLARIAPLAQGQGEQFVRALDDTLNERLTSDFWGQSLVMSLETQRARSPAALGFRAAQIVLGARALFSDQPLRNLLAPLGQGSRAAAEAHHLFPKAFLSSCGVTERRRINQFANRNRSGGGLRPGSAHATSGA